MAVAKRQMMIIRIGILHCAVVWFATAAPVQIASKDTTLLMEAGSGAPLLNGLAFQSGRVWQNLARETFIDHLEIQGLTKPVAWRFRASRSDGTSVRFVYESSEPHLRLYWEWRFRALNGPAEHSIRIQNLSTTDVWLPLQPSFRFEFRVAQDEPLQQLWVEKGASSPSSVGTHTVALKDGYRWTGTSSTYAHPQKSEQREIIPYLLVERSRSDGSGLYMGIEFSGRTQITLSRSNKSISGEAGLNPNPGPYVTKLPAGDTFETPTIFVGAFEDGPDGAGNVLRRWIREVLANPITLRNPSYPMLVSNSWGSGMGVDDDRAYSMIQDASELGLEMFHLDAGWFRGVGDWVSDPQKFPHGVSAVVEFAHRKGLKFGLWTDWTQAGASRQPGALNAFDPKYRNWLTTDPPIGWKPAEFKGITIDIGVPAAMHWAATIVTNLVGTLHIDMLEHDGYLVAQGCERNNHPHAPVGVTELRRYKDEDFLWADGPNSTDVSDHATRAYYQIQTVLRQQFPGLLLEICNDGGRMVDFGSAAHGDYFSITDAYDPVSNRKAFFDASYVLPPAMLETYVQKWETPRIENFRYMLRSGMMGWFTLMQDSITWTREQHQEASEQFALYKSKLRPLIREADLFHVAERPDGLHWDGVEYFNKVKRNGVLFTFRSSSGSDASHTFRLNGLSKGSKYQVTFQDHSSKDFIATGQHLMTDGVTVREMFPNSSELVFLNETAPASAHE